MFKFHVDTGVWLGLARDARRVTMPAVVEELVRPCWVAVRWGPGNFRADARIIRSKEVDTMWAH